jgi:hypothetical protein
MDFQSNDGISGYPPAQLVAIGTIGYFYGPLAVYFHYYGLVESVVA